ncbi:MAG TPA: hypothetical protein VII95_18665 [Terriglobales bacterium]|jgi:hypothetical protein
MESKHYFSEKGAAAEKVIHNLATKTFFTDWCYPNPKKPDGNELCDLFIVFDDTAIIWQIKDLRSDEHGRYKKAEVEKNLRQLGGARRYLFDLKVPIWLENPWRGKEKFDPDQIKSVHLISVLMGEGEEPFPFVQFVKNRMIHVFTREFADIALSELDTVSDFCDYLRKKESIDKNKTLVVSGGEENLLGKYLELGHSFSWMDNYDHILIDDTIWPKFLSLVQVQAKKEADRISYGWDSIIDRAHDGTSSQYELVARELARPDRFQRRLLSKSFWEAYCEYRELDRLIFRRATVLGDTTYCLLFMEDGEEPRKKRREMLSLMCFVARGLYPDNKRVIGIATEAETRSYDFCLRVQAEWTVEDEENKKKVQEKTGIFVNPRKTQDGEDEYPAPE